MNSVNAWRSQLIYRDHESKLNSKTITIEGRLGKLRANMHFDLTWDPKYNGNRTKEGLVWVWGMSKQYMYIRLNTTEQSVRCFKLWGLYLFLQSIADKLRKTAYLAVVSLLLYFFMTFFLRRLNWYFDLSSVLSKRVKLSALKCACHVSKIRKSHPLMCGSTGDILPLRDCTCSTCFSA